MLRPLHLDHLATRGEVGRRPGEGGTPCSTTKVTRSRRPVGLDRGPLPTTPPYTQITSVLVRSQERESKDHRETSARCTQRKAHKIGNPTVPQTEACAIAARLNLAARATQANAVRIAKCAHGRCPGNIAHVLRTQNAYVLDIGSYVLELITRQALGTTEIIFERATVRAEACHRRGPGKDTHCTGIDSMHAIERKACPRC